MRRLALITLLLLVGACSPSPKETGTEAAKEQQHEDGFGKYTNPESRVYDGFNRYSQYIPASDGTRLAVDVLIPTRNGKEATEPLPAILHYTRYIRALEDENGEVHGRENDPVLEYMLEHGYAIAAADARGTGASFGVHVGPFSEKESEDSVAIINWLAAQPWSNGRIGMAGRSYPGMTQYQAAARAPGPLKAIFAEMAGPSAYDFAFRGGAIKENFIRTWGDATRKQDLGQSGDAARVDADADGELRAKAIAEHENNLWAQELFERPGAELRDGVVDYDPYGRWTWNTIATIDDVEAIGSSGIGVYHVVGWYDIYTTQQPWMYQNLDDAPQKMMIGPWVHSGGYGGEIHKAEMLRWYDYWLKQIDNGVMNEDPIHYYVMQGNHTVPQELPEQAESVAPSVDEERAQDPENWIATGAWPPAAELRSFWFEAGTGSATDSVNDGRLVTEAPEPGSDSYEVDYSARMGSFSRWMNGYGARREPGNTTFFDERSAEDAKVLTYTTAPLENDLTIIGYPRIHLWVRSNHTDGDFFAYLEEVDSEGRVHYISEGVIRASHRRATEPPFENFDLPWHRSHQEDIQDLVPGEATRLSFDLMGTAIRIDKGHRLRVAIAGADSANFGLHPDPEGQAAPDIEILRGGQTASHVELPVIASARR